MQKMTRSLGLMGRILISAGILMGMTGHANAQTAEMVSLRSDGSLPGGIGLTDYMPAVTPDGRYVAFTAEADTLVAPNASGDQIYLRDRVLGTMELISADNAGNPGNGSSRVSPSISADGCKVVFSSSSSNLVPGDTNGLEDVFVRDRCSMPPQTSVVSVSTGGTLGNGASAEARISANGRYVVFSSYTTNLVPPYGDSTWNTLYVRDLQTATTEVLYIDPLLGSQAIFGGWPDISADGNRVVFFAYGRPESPALWQIYGFERNTSTLVMVSADAAGVGQAQVDGASTVHKPAISGDGLWAAFASNSKTLVPGVIDGNRHVYVKDFTTGAIHVADVASDGTLGNSNSSGSGAGERPSISYDSTWVTFSTFATNLFPNAPFQSVILRNIHTGETRGLTADSTSALPAISSDVNGRFVSFYSQSHLDPRFQARGYFLLDRAGRLINLSTRGQVQTGDNVMIGGFIIGGTTPKKVLIRAVGPNLANYGVTGVLPDPSLQLFSGQTPIASNDNWGAASNHADITATGLAPVNALESAILTTLSPGAYTAIVSGNGGGTGVGIVEVYELDHPEIPLINISTRGKVLTGDNVMIGGFIIQGDSAKTVLIRAVGPNLANYGVTGVLANPKLELYSGQTVIASNDDWGTSTNVLDITATGLAPVNALESAILITLEPGAYTAIVSGADGGSGVGIVEVFAQ